MVALVGMMLLAVALTIDVPKSARGFKGDEATYYSLGHSLARDFDFTFERQDLIRVWEDFPGPQGIFLKRGKTLRHAAAAPLSVSPAGEGGRSGPEPAVLRQVVHLPAGRRAVRVRSSGPMASWSFTPCCSRLDLFVAYTFLAGRGGSRPAALAYATVFLAASVVPVYYVWLTPELFNFSLTLYALFLWS